jgi:hypothetical protein
VTESFLHYVWQFQYFDRHSLTTTAGDPILVFNPGQRNPHSGPDFFNARIKIDDMEWIGSVEIHIYASGWIDHKHNTDALYDNVVLHVVWGDDKIVTRSDGSMLPTLELKNRVSEYLLLHYRRLVYSPEAIPCASKLFEVKPVIVTSMLEKVLVDRLEIKANSVLKLLERNGSDWEETCYQILTRNFGFKVNNDPFHQLSLALPYKTLLKHADKLSQVEALLFGQAGFLEEENNDEYFSLLKREYKFLSQKYRIADKRLNKIQWRFLRMRPANFPTIRIAQLACLIHKGQKFFSTIIAIHDVRELEKFFSAHQSAYWMHHYHFFKEFKKEIDTLGGESINSLIINTVAPVLVAYGKAKDDEQYIDRAVSILQDLPAETNRITRRWRELGLNVKNAFDSQAMVGLYNNFCLKRRCLDCKIGASLVNPLQR